MLADLPENVAYEGASHPGGVAEMMRQADIFVLPTLEDSFALVVFEAMATGLPVVTTSHAGASEMIEAGDDGLILPAGDVDALAEAIRRLVQSPELCRELGAAARRKVQGAHSWEDYGRRVMEKIVAGRQELGLCDGLYG